MRVLLIDDDVRLTELLATWLGREGFEVERRHDGASGLGALSGAAFDAVVLDVMMPGMDGFEVLHHLRRSQDVPVLMLTAKGEPTDRVRGLDGGADDYLPKPFDPRELAARLRAITRRVRAGAGGDKGVLRAGGVEVDLDAREVRKDGKRLPLTSLQYQLVAVLAQRPGQVLDRELLMRLAKGDDSDAFDRSIDVHISRIRALLEDDPREPRVLQTVRGAGYVFAPRTPR